MRATWTGAISFGLVTIPVKLYLANEDKQVKFNHVHGKDAGAIKYRRFCTICDEEVEYADIASGYKHADGHLSVITDEDLATLPITSVHEMSVDKFVKATDIAVELMSGKNYYVEPQPGGQRAYELLRGSLAGSKLVGVVKLAVRQRERLGILRAQGRVILLQMLYWPDEIRGTEFEFLKIMERNTTAEKDMARQIVASMTGVFDPKDYTDNYREAVNAVAEGKVMAIPKRRQEVSGDLLTKLQATVADQQRRKARKRARSES